MKTRRAAAIAVLAALLPFAAAPALAQNAPIANPPGGPITLATLPDLAVISVTAQLSCVGGASVTATVAAKLRNFGTSAADFSKIAQQVGIAARWDATPGNGLLVSLLQTANPQLSINPPIKPGETRDFTLVIAGIPEFKANIGATPQYVFVATADPKKGISESNENNNESLAYAVDPCPK